MQLCPLLTLLLLRVCKVPNREKLLYVAPKKKESAITRQNRVDYELTTLLVSDLSCFKKVKETSVVTNRLKINLCTGTDALLNSSIIDSMWQTSSRYTFFKRKKEKDFFFPLLYRERCHLFGLTTLLTNYHSAVKKERGKKKSFKVLISFPDSLVSITIYRK